MTISTKFTHADLLLMPNDGKRREIVDGDLLVTPSPLSKHQLISIHLATALSIYLREHPIGEVLAAPLDVILSDFDVLEPDLLFISNERRSILKDWVRGAPDLVVEILSPTTEAIDRGPKMKAYARFGVPEYWIVDSDRKAIEVYQLVQNAYRLAQTFTGHETLTTGLLPGFTLRVEEIFNC